jgi:hypothetical protein
MGFWAVLRLVFVGFVLGCFFGLGFAGLAGHVFSR